MVEASMTDKELIERVIQAVARTHTRSPILSHAEASAAIAATRTEAAEVLGRINRAANAILASDVECMSATIEKVVRDIAALSASIPTGAGEVIGWQPKRQAGEKGSEWLFELRPTREDALVRADDARPVYAALTPTASDSGEVTGADLSDDDAMAILLDATDEKDAGYGQDIRRTLRAIKRAHRLAHTTAEPTEREAKLVDELRDAYTDNLWNAYHTGSERNGEWTHMFMSDGESLASECGFDARTGHYPAEEIKAAIPAAVERKIAALTKDGE